MNKKGDLQIWHSYVLGCELVWLIFDLFLAALTDCQETVHVNEQWTKYAFCVIMKRVKLLVNHFGTEVNRERCQWITKYTHDHNVWNGLVYHYSHKSL
jgi:hypothetical protein